MLNYKLYHILCILYSCFRIKNATTDLLKGLLERLWSSERDVPLGPITFSLTYMASLEILHYLTGFQYTNHNCLRKCFSGSIQGETTAK